MFNPMHPGEILRESYLDAYDLNITQASEKLGVTRKAMSELVNGKTGISLTMAFRLSKAFNTSTKFWLNMQMEYDLWINRNLDKTIQVSVITNQFEAE